MNEKNKSIYEFDPINLLRVYATLLVFLLHASIFSGRYGFAFSKKTFILKTPAWAAVWIFFLLSGYLTGKQFFSGRYKLEKNGILDFYLGRFFKVLLPTYIFVFLCCLVLQPGFVLENPRVLIQFITCTFNNSIGFDAIGPTWYVFTLVWLYIVAPFFIWILKEINRKIKITHVNEILVIAVIVAGFCLRFIGYRYGWNWSEKVYTPFYMNIDIFLCGIIFSYIRCEKLKNKTASLISCIGITFILFIIVIINSYIYNINDYFTYQYIFPSIYILVVGCYLLFWDRYEYKNIKTNKWINKCVNMFSGLSFSFYLLHCLVLQSVSGLIKIQRPILMHIILIIISFVLTVIMAIIYNFVNKGCMQVYKNIKR